MLGSTNHSLAVKPKPPPDATEALNGAVLPSTGIPDALRIDGMYRNTSNWRSSHDVFNRFFRFKDGKGINNASGFRPKSRSGGSTEITDCAFCILVTTFGESEWPDSLDPETGVFAYFGDNRSPGAALSETTNGGNRLLERTFELLHSGQRNRIPPFLCFEKCKTTKGTYMRFLGLAAPGAIGVSAFQDLTAVWRIKGRARFQNYCALLTILAVEQVPWLWLSEMVDGHAPTESTHCPKPWKLWTDTGLLTPLLCTRRREPRSRSEQLPRTSEENQVLNAICSGFNDREFEFAAAAISKLMDTRFGDLSVTRRVRDGGRDVIATYRVGHDEHQVLLSVFVEAKSWNTSSAVGVKPMMRLISRLKHRDIGVFVTTSFFDKQVQQELIDDNHPVLLVSGGDIARILIKNELADLSPDGKLRAWIESVRAACRIGDAPAH